MSPPRRRSARLASSGSSSKTGKAAAAPQLDSLTEREESSSEQAAQSSTVATSPPKPSTPAASSPVKLTMSEMHPSKVHPTMADAPSSALKLGFTDINLDQKPGDAQSTPSKTGPPTSPFTFRFARTRADLELGPEIQQIMDDLRKEAAAKRLQERKETAEVHERKIAQAKSRIDMITGDLSKNPSVMANKVKKAATPGPASQKAGFLSPIKSGIKRSPSKANLDESDSAPQNFAAGIKRSQSKANLNEPNFMSRKIAPARPTTKFAETRLPGPESPSKRVRQHIEDDASTRRPVSRDDSAIPRPKSSGNDSIRRAVPRSQTLANLMTPTKASAARAVVTKTPTITLLKSPSKSDLGDAAKTPSKAGLFRSPSKPDLANSFTPTPHKNLGGLKKSVTYGDLGAGQSNPTVVQTPGRFDRVKSILKRQFSASKPKSGLPTKTPGRTEQQAPSTSVTTPVQKMDKHVEFTPETKQIALTQNSPSPIKSSLPRSKTFSKLSTPSLPSFATVMSAKKTLKKEVSYPDLSAYADKEKTEEEEEETTEEPKSPLPESVPGTFTFRSDHTIRFDSASPNGFGGSAGQASLRHVRNPVAPTSRMPGSFPSVSLGESSPNKENKDPIFKFGIPHGISNKKRHRALWEDEELKTGIPHGLSNKKRNRTSSDDEGDDENMERAAKKLRKANHTAGGAAFSAPRLIKSSPMKKLTCPSQTPSPQKKAGISLSRLQLLAQPKHRKA